MSELAEDRVFARHARVRGSVLIVGAGAVGGFVAEELAAMGISPLWLIDKDVLEIENLVRHPLGKDYLDQSKAGGLADRIRLERPWCEVHGRRADFLKDLSLVEQRWHVDQADVVVAATDEADCQRRVNRVCFAAEKQAVFPGVWVDPRTRDAEVSEILWVLPGRHTPCYDCWSIHRQADPNAGAARGARADIQQLALATAVVVRALLEPDDPRSGILDPERNAIYIHGLTTISEDIRPTFPVPERDQDLNVGTLQSRNVRVDFPPTPCPGCQGVREVAETGPMPVNDRVAGWRDSTPLVDGAAAWRESTPEVDDDSRWRPTTQESLAAFVAVCLAVMASAIIWLIGWGIDWGSGSDTAEGHAQPTQLAAPTSPPSALASPTPPVESVETPTAETSEPTADPTPQDPRGVLPAGMYVTCRFSLSDDVYRKCPPGLHSDTTIPIRFTVEGLDRAVWSPLENKGYELHFVDHLFGHRTLDDCVYDTPPNDIHCDITIDGTETPFTSGIIITNPSGYVIDFLRYRLGGQ